ncbi:hypothetical protein FQN55_003497 [Onygenales sp. PD_40]|nr:hypothetical protein FQN55_003497 [Onygenales sp. PD_40]
MAYQAIPNPIPSISALQIQQKHETLWDQAVKSLNEEDRKLIDFRHPDKLSVLDDVLAVAEKRRSECLQRRWRIRKKNGDIILRDVFEKIIKWVNNFKTVGDVAVQFDPTHASLPWAGVRLLLQWAINDSQIFGAMIEGLEMVAHLIARYSLFEALYLRIHSPATARLRRSIVTVYAAILMFLGKPLHYYGKSAANRFAKSLVQVSDTTLNDLMQDVRSRQVQVEQDAQLVLMELQQNTADVVTDIHQANTGINLHLSDITTNLSSLEHASVDQFTHLQNLMWRIEQPIFRITDQLSNYQDGLEKAERLRVLDWLSQVPYPQHHANVQVDRLVSSGAWMLAKPQFTYWASSSSSSILWLHGIPGSGKTKLASVVIDECLARAPNGPAIGFAYFYCARNPTEPLRADPLEILRCIARQLSCPNLTVPIQPATIERYNKERDEGFSLRKLDLRGVVDLILKITADNPSTIVIDGLDECDPSRRHDVLDALNDIIQKSSNVVKVFVTSRDDGDIVCRLEGSPNIYIDVQDNAEDIARFIEVEIENAINQKRLLRGEISSGLKDTLTSTLRDGAQGMFRWVSLQLQNLCNPYRMKVESDVRMELGRLPKTLSDLYTTILNQIQESGPRSRRIGIRALKWVLGAAVPLSREDFIAAISAYENGGHGEITTQSVLDMTCNLLVYDTLVNKLRLAHLSVREHLETIFTPEDLDLEIALGCLALCFPEHMLKNCPPSTRPDHGYAVNHWQYHCARVSTELRKEHIPCLGSILFTDNGTPSPAFARWKRSYPCKKPGNPIPAAHLHPFVAVCAYGFSDILERMNPTTVLKLNESLLFEPSLQKSNRVRWCGLHLAAYYNKASTVVALLDKGVDTAAPTWDGKTALHIAAERGNTNVVEVLVEYGADPHASTIVYRRHTHSSIHPFDNPIRPASSLGFRNAGGGYESIQEEDSEAVIHFAASSGSENTVKLMLEYGADVNARTSQGSTPLHKALEAGKEGIVELLIDAGADVNSPLLFARTPLHFVAGLGQEKVAAHLLRKGADRTKRDVFGSYPFQVAQRYGFESMAEMLKPTPSELESSGTSSNWLLQFDENDPPLAPSQSIPEVAVTEWTNLPIRNHMLEDIAKKQEQKRRLHGLPSHLLFPEASRPSGNESKDRYTKSM